MKDALKRYLMGMHTGLCASAILLVASCLALSWHYRWVWMSLDLARSPLGWVLEQHPSWKLALLAGIPGLVGLLIIWAALGLLVAGRRKIKSSDRPWTVPYGSTFFFIFVQLCCLGWMSLFLLAWPAPDPVHDTPPPTASPSASPSASPDASPDASPSPSASPSPLKNPFAIGSSSPSPSASPAATDPFLPGKPSQPVAGVGTGRYVEFFDGMTLTVEREFDLGRPSNPRQFTTRDGVLYWCDGAHLTAVDLTQGASTWRVDTTGEEAVLAAVSGLVLTRGPGNKTFAHASSNGELLWQHQGTILVDGDRLFQVAADQQSLGKPLEGPATVLVRLEPQTGKPKGELVKLKWPLLEPQVDSAVVVGKATDTPMLHILDATSGGLLWSSTDAGAFLARSGRLYISVEEGTYVRELRTGKPLAAGRTLAGSVVASFSGSAVMHDPVKQELVAYDPGNGEALWGWEQVRGWPLVGREGMLLLGSENGAPLLIAYDGKGGQIFKGPLDPALGLRGVLGARDNTVVLLVEKQAVAP